MVIFNFQKEVQFQPYLCRDLRKGPYIGKIKIEFCISCSRGHSACNFGTKIMYLAKFLTELLQIQSIKTCIMEN